MKRQYNRNSSSSSSEPNLLNKIIMGENGNIHTLLQKRETETKRRRINTGTKTFYRFRNLDHHYSTYALIRFLNQNNVKFYIIDYNNGNDNDNANDNDNGNNIKIKEYTGPYDVKTQDAQSELEPLNYRNEDDEIQYAMITDDIYGFLNGEEYLIGNNVDFLNYMYLNESGTCFYYIKNPNFFTYIQNIDSKINISDEVINLNLHRNDYD
jgi:hypothetical protein